MKTIKILIPVIILLFVSNFVFSQEKNTVLEKERINKQKMDNKQSEIELVADLREKLKEMNKQGIDHASVEYRQIELEIEQKIYDYRKGNPNYSSDEIKFQKNRLKFADQAYKDALCVQIDKERAAENQRLRDAEKEKE